MGCQSSTTIQIPTQLNVFSLQEMGNVQKQTVPTPSSQFQQESIKLLDQVALKMTKDSAQVQEMPDDKIHLMLFQRAIKLIQNKQIPNTDKIADRLFKCGYIEQAIQVYQTIIETNPYTDSQFLGLGNSQMAQSYFIWSVYSWYTQMKQNKKLKGSAYDALSLCYLIVGKQDKYENLEKRGILWYRKMAQIYPQNIGILMGLGNILYSQAYYDQSLIIYDKVLEVRPDFINALVNKAFIYQFKRIDNSKSVTLANKILEIDTCNQFAFFILARNTQDIQQKITKLKQYILICPQYTRLLNELGMCSTKIKQYDQAIQYFLKCIQQNPKYQSAYANVGTNYLIKKSYNQAKTWFYKALQIQPVNESVYGYLRYLYQKQQYNFDQIQNQIQKHPQLSKQQFYLGLGMVYYDKDEILQAKYWIQMSIKINDNICKSHNCLAMCYEEMDNIEQAINCYLRCIEIDPQFYVAYFNAATVYAGKKRDFDMAIKMYQKAIEVHPRYSYAYNNLGRIYKDRQEYEQAVFCYQNAIQHNSTYTLALASLGFSYLMQGKYKNAFYSFERAQKCLPTDNNKLSKFNKQYLKQVLAKFNQQGAKWKKTGSLTNQQKQNLQSLIKQFQSKFKSLEQGKSAIQVSPQKIMNQHIISIISLINQDKFQLKNLDKILQQVEKIFHDDEQYFHIIPLLIIQKFVDNVINKKREIVDVELQLRNIIKKASDMVLNKIEVKPVEKVSEEIGEQTKQIKQQINIQLTECIPTNKYPNLFQDTTYFHNYEELCIEIAKVNQLAKVNFSQFSIFVDTIRKKSSGLPGGISTKIPLKTSEQFKVYLRIMEKMFKKQLDSERVIKMIKKIGQNLKNLKKVSLQIVVKQIMKGWTEQITQILKSRDQNKIQTVCKISDFIRAKCLYNSVEDLLKGVKTADKYCKKFGYTMIQVQNRLNKIQTQDIMIKVQLKGVLCQIQLAMNQDQKTTHLDHALYEILRSPLGSIFGSYLYMSKQVKYPLTANCRDICHKLKQSKNKKDTTIKQHANYILNALGNQHKK